MINFCLIIHTLLLTLDVYLVNWFKFDKERMIEIFFKIFEVFYIVEGTIVLFYYIFFSQNKKKFFKKITSFIFIFAFIISVYDFFYFKVGKPKVVRVLRLAFVLRLLINFKKMAELTTYIFYTIGPLSQVGASFLLVILIYSVVGVKLLEMQ